MGAGLIGQRPGDGLADPPGGVGGKLVAQGAVEFLCRPNQAQVALLDQVHQRHAPAGVALGLRDHQAKVGLQQVVFGALAVSHDPAQIPAQLRGQLVRGVVGPAQPLGGKQSRLDALGQVHLLFGGEQGHLADLLEIRADRIGRGAELSVRAGLAQLLRL
jgi:hypothetical protein